MNRHDFILGFAIGWASLVLAACGDPVQKFSIKVVDEKGLPSGDVECKAWFKKAGDQMSYKDYFVTGRTGADGRVELKGETIWAPTQVEARARDCYLSIASDHWALKQNGNRWEPWPVEVELVMREIRKPHPMHALACGPNHWFQFPGNKMGPFGFDLLARDWVAPHGAGKVADLVLEGVLRDPGDRSFDPKGWIRITFSNEGDGILPDSQSRHSGGSLMVGRYEAPEDGYLGEWKFANFLPERESDRDNPVVGAPRMILRLRSEMKDGRVERALYGKMYAGLFPALSPNLVAFQPTYYLNAEPNERNLEWDMKTNLFADLPRERWPRQP